MASPAAFDPKSFKGKTAGVIGLGLSGIAAARLLKRKGFKVFGTDAGPRAQVKERLGRLASSITWEASGHSDRVLKCRFVVKSPGIAPSTEILRRLKEKGVPVFSELEVALAFCKAKDVVAITGTNGKTTTTALTTAILKEARPLWGRVQACGNIGAPVSDAADAAGPKDALVLEASSYQLEDSRRFRPRAAALLNITPDHLDHHGSMARYVEAKAAVFRDQGPDDFMVFNAADPLALGLSRRCRAQKLFFTSAPGGGLRHAWLEGGKIHLKLPGGKETVVAPPALPGRHNLENAMAAALVASCLGVGPAPLRKAFKAFKGVEHRLEEAGAFKGIRCVNDSKATNVDSTLVALKAMAEECCPKDAAPRLMLILGGLHKGSPYKPLAGLIQSQVKCILTIGAAARKIEDDLSGLTHIFPCADLSTAVDTAFRVGAKGDVLLLSPACASFDQFRDFEDRGRRFKELVKELGAKA